MKLCTRIIDVKNEYESTIVLWWVDFFWKIISLLPFQILTSPIFLNPLSLLQQENFIHSQIYRVWNGLFIFCFSIMVFWHKLLAEFCEITRVFLKSRMLSYLIFLLKSTTLDRKIVFSVIWLNSCFSQFKESPFPFWH